MNTFFHFLLFCSYQTSATAFSSIGNSRPSFSLSDRFRASCPAEASSISQFDPTLLVDDDKANSKDSVWVAVFRSSNNLPSVLIKDDFLNAMRIATTVQSNGDNSDLTQSTQINSGSLTNQIENSSVNIKKSSTLGGGVKAQTPVAVAKLSPSTKFDGKWVLEAMRCSLKKDDFDESCDGLSEHAEAISICIDELLLNHLRMGNQFDGSIRTKATLISGKILENRGFEEVNELCIDMATHVSSLENSLNRYTERAVETVSRSPGARDRALQILSYLSKQEIVKNSNKNDSEQEYDPWANIGRL